MERNDQDIKSIFLYTFVNWAKVYIEEYTLSLIDFVDWLASKYGSGLFCPFAFCFFVSGILHVYLFSSLLALNEISLPIKKKKTYLNSCIEISNYKKCHLLEGQKLLLRAL